MPVARVCLFALTFTLTTALVEAAPITFFAEDLNGNPNARIAFPNSSTARSNFLAQVPLSGTDSLEELAGGTLATFSMAFSGVDLATVSAANGSIQTISSGTDGFGRFPTSGANLFETNAAATTFTFTRPITAFGFYGIDIGAFGGQLTLQLGLAAGGSRTITVPNAIGGGTGSTANGSVLFFGYLDSANPLTTVQLLDSSASDTFGFDDFIIGVAPQGTATPEPGSISLFIAGIFGIGIARSIRRAPSRF